MLGADVGELYKPLLTVQIIGVVFILVLSLFLGVREKGGLSGSWARCPPWRI